MDIKLQKNQFNRLFPFYVLVDPQLRIKGFGKSIAKILPLTIDSFFFNSFSIARPQITDQSFDGLKKYFNQLIIVNYLGDNELSLRGQIEYLEGTDNLLFIITPWFSSMDHVKEYEIKLDDFAIHDPLIDVLHVLKTQEIVTEEVKELLATVRRQRNDLQQLSMIAEETVNGVVIANSHGEIDWVNKGFERITGYTLKEVKGKKPGSFLQGPNTADETIQYLSTQLKAKLPFVCELINYNKNGLPYWIRINGQPLINSKGQHEGFFAIEENITKEKEAFIQLQEYEERFKVALEKIGDNVWIYDFDTKKTEFTTNDSHFALNTISDFEITSQNWFECMHPEDMGLFDSIDQQYRQGLINHHSVEYRIIQKNGQIKWILDRGVVFEKDMNGRPIKIIGTHTDITGIKEVEYVINNQKKFYENILNKIPADIAVLDRDRRYKFLNPVAIKNDELREWIIGKTDEEYFEYRNRPLDVVKSRKELFNLAVQTKKLQFYIEELINPEGETEYHLRNMYPVLDENGEVDLIIGYGLNITDRIKIEKELQQAKKETEESAMAKETFLANMSHEIRTPMNGIMGITDLLAKTELNPRQEEYVHLIKESANNLLVIVNDVLDFEKMIAGKLELETITFNIVQKLKYTIETFRFKAEEKDLYIQFDNSLSPDLLVEGDPYRLNQIMFNLIGNAIKFTEEGGIKVTTSIVETNDDIISIQIVVTDTGIGIQKDYLDNIFNPYVQAKAEISRKYGGTGLGLSICKNLVDIQKGGLNVISEEHKGSSFIVTIPYKKSVLISLKDKPAIDYNSMKGRRVLVAEDVEINQYVVRNILDRWGCDTTIVENGIQAIEAVNNNAFDVILMDIQMPEMNGVQATEAIRKLNDKTKANIPIIAVTANSLKGISKRYAGIGMTEYLLKPYNEENLFTIIDNVLRNEVPNKIKKEELPLNFPTKPLLKDNLIKMSGGDEGFANKLAEIFIRTSPEIYEQMLVALQAKDWELISRQAHKFNSSVIGLDIKEAMALVKKIENNARNQIDLENIENDVKRFGLILDETITQIKSEFL